LIASHRREDDSLLCSTRWSATKVSRYLLHLLTHPEIMHPLHADCGSCQNNDAGDSEREAFN
jgi:hypothetical protein